MDELEQYRTVIKTLLSEFTTRQYANPDILELQNKTVFDTTQDHYVVMSDGWNKNGSRIHGCLMDIQIINGKIWIQRDGTEYGIALDLMEAGIPQDRIVLGYKEPSIRPYTGFAIA
ncbi:XisI protein [Roseofilum sp. BLCC_M154]|uniref:XisI protein n=1 Tax=Roseofilum acuticapitatum BLCC-M154 TaxID=3022444 RepID=A0ABT7AX90_9CYAN|nr:XisI protein [Roseofilum acuticapitatum]MDJ1171506.1 XisI protein [Roseofilum acuticapitatum BLCC-M154]